jgi:hypothetical protein
MNAFSENHRYSLEELSRVIYVMPSATQAHTNGEHVRRALNTIKKLDTTPQEIKDLIVSSLVRGWCTRPELELIFPCMQPPRGSGNYKVLCWDKAPRQLLPLFELLPQNEEAEEAEPVIEVKQTAAKPATRSNYRSRKFSFSSKTNEEIWEIIDQRILDCASSPITAKVLYKKARTSGPDRKRFQEYVVHRRDLLLAQGKLHTWTEPSSKGRTITYYCVNPPIELKTVPSVAEVKVIGQVETGEQPGAIVPVINILASPVMVQDFLLDQHDHEFLEHFKNPDERMFLAVCTTAAEKIGRPIEWVEFEERLWLTVKQSANLLGMDERTVRHHLQQFPFEMSVLSEKLTDDRLNAYKQCYSLEPPEPHQSDWCGSGELGGSAELNEKAAHEYSTHFILISPAGVTWLAKASATRPAKAIIKEFMMKADKVAPIMEQMGAHSRNALSQKDREEVSLLVDLKEGDKKIISLLETLVESRNRTDKEIISLLKTIAPAATRTEEGIDSVKEIVNEINRNTNSPRKEFLPDAISSAIEAFLHITLNTGRDVLDQTLLIDTNGFKTKDCEFDHIRSRSDRSAQNCMPLSKTTHRKKTHGQLTSEEKAKLERAEKAIENYWAQKNQIKPQQSNLFENQAV